MTSTNSIYLAVKDVTSSMQLLYTHSGIRSNLIQHARLLDVIFLLELLNPAGAVHNFLLLRVEGMAI